MRLDDIEQLEHDRGDTAKMAGTELAFKLVLDIRRIKLVFLRLRIKLTLVGRKKHIDPRRDKPRTIVLEGTRILVEILVRAELQAIHEDAGDHRITEPACLLHQGNMSGVQVAHGRNKNNASAIFQRGAKISNGRMDQHGFLISGRKNGIVSQNRHRPGLERAAYEACCHTQAIVDSDARNKVRWAPARSRKRRARRCGSKLEMR